MYGLLTQIVRGRNVSRVLTNSVEFPCQSQTGGDCFRTAAMTPLAYASGDMASVIVKLRYKPCTKGGLTRGPVDVAFEQVGQRRVDRVCEKCSELSTDALNRNIYPLAANGYHAHRS